MEEEDELLAGDIVRGTDYGEAFDETLNHPGTYHLPPVGMSPERVIDFVPRFNGQLDQ